MLDAVIFASGAATRAQSYANGRSKCLLPLPDGDAVLDKIMVWLTAAGIRRVTLLTTYDAHGVEVQEHARRTQVVPRLRFVGEACLGGTVAALRAYVDTFPPDCPTLLLNHDTILTIPFLAGMIETFYRLSAEVLDARAVGSGTSSGVRLLSSRALQAATLSFARNIEGALLGALVYPVSDDAFIDVGTAAGYQAARCFYGEKI
jgi:NDP-sugar pyrophosphorylase family protein